MTTMREALEAAYDEAEKKESDVSKESFEDEIFEDDADEGENTEDETLDSDDAEDDETEQAVLKEASEIDIPVPDSWSGVVKEKWSELPPEVRAEIKRREDDFHKGMTKLDEDRNFGLRMKEVMNPYMPIIQSEGAKPEDVLKGYLNIEYVLRQGAPEQKANLLRQVMHQFNIDPNMVVYNDQQRMDPYLSSIQNELMAIKQQIAEKEQLQQQQQYDKIVSEIEAFASNPENVYFEEVKAQMGALIESGQAKDLKEAYETAIWANPNTRSRLLEKQQADLKVKRQKELALKKKAASTLTTTPGQNGQSGKGTSKSIREELESGLNAILSSSRI